MANVKNVSDILIGTGRMYVDNSDLGQLQGDVTFTNSKENYELKAGFPQTIIVTIKTSESLKLACTLLETNLETIRTLMPEYKAITGTAGSATVTDEVVAVTAGKLSLLAHQQLSGTITVKTNADTPATLTEGTDFYLDRISGTITRVSSSANIDDGDKVKVSYTYATYASAGFGVGGGSSTSDTFKIDFYHKRRDGNYRHICIFKGKITGDFAMAFKETAESPLNLEITAEADSTKDAGSQYMTVLDVPAASVPGGGW